MTGFNGNISARVDADTILITATGTCLGYLKPTDIVTLNFKTGEVIGEGKASSERFMHTEVYKNFPDIKAVVHTHPTYTNGFFLSNEILEPKTFEAKFYLGIVKSVPQSTPSVTAMEPVIKELKVSNIVVLRNHGVVAIGKDLFYAFVLIQELEEQTKVELVDVHYQEATPTRGHVAAKASVSPRTLPSDVGLNVKAPQEMTKRRQKIQTLLYRTNRRNCPFSQWRCANAGIRQQNRHEYGSGCLLAGDGRYV